MFKKTFLSIVASLVFMAAANIHSYAQSANLVLDGDFTSGSLSPNWTLGSPATGAGAGVNVSGSNGPIQNERASVYVTRPSTAMSIQQSVPVTSGKVYRFNFGYQTNLTSGPAVKAILIDGGNVVTYNLTLTGNAGSAEVVKSYTPVTSNLIIKFEITSSGFGTQYVWLDNVSLTEML
jgi:hypothetical protein